MTRIPIAVQLYSVRHECEKDLAGTLAKIKAMGYEGVEFAGWYGNDAATLKALLDENGLACAGAHVGIDTLLGENFETSVAFHKTLGNKFLIVPGLASKWTNSTEAWRETANVFNEIAAKLAPHGMVTGYHNHHTEFKPFGEGGELPWDTFFGNTDKSIVMQFDTGNALHGGSSANALDFLTRYPGRALTIHLKDYNIAHDSYAPPVGDGDVPFTEIFAECETNGNTEWYIVEYEDDALPALEGIERCLVNVKAMGK
ncbi:sugar phosphate isomerase/epimerase family protein [Armatimonas sp.]|uniref:sugar phosphate isomerase/epimerase family protein n=1 Tax=Armatimonas sp. TaxID=1872638 RepID=UPI0037532186